MFRPIIAGMLVAVERRGLIEVFTEKERVLWKKWQLRFLVVFSLLLQILLIWLGKIRKRNGKPWLRFTVWSAYLLADLVATVALGVISNNVQAKPKNHASLGVDLVSFWAPFLLLHLGGPDSITAYSLEDNQLWQRRLLELVMQTSVAFYIFLTALPDALLSYLSLAMLGVGVIKFGERIWSLKSASTEQFRQSLMTEPDPGPNYSKFMEEFTLKKAEGFYVRADAVVEAPLPISVSIAGPGQRFDMNADEVNGIRLPISAPMSVTAQGFDVIADEVKETHLPVSANNEELVLRAYDLFQTFKCLFVDLILSFQDREKSQFFFHDLKPETAFSVIEIELGFAFDVFYTKAPVVYNRRGYTFRLISFFVTLTSLLVFFSISRSRRVHYDKTDLAITYLMLGGAVTLEICALMILLFSDWSVKHYKTNCDLFRQLLWSTKRWSNLIPQLSILDFCRKEKHAYFPWIQKLFMADKMLDKIRCIRYSEVSPCLKELVFQQFMQVSKSGNKSDLTALCTSRGTSVLKNFQCSDDLTWSATGVDFDQSILLWHIATELCYYSDSEGSGALKMKERKESKLMSDYLLYLLVMCPFMLPIGIGMMRFRDTCAEADEFFREKRDDYDEAQACKMLLRVNTEVPPGKVKGDRSKSVLFDACRLATSLRAKGQTVKWEIISQVWVEILAYAACHCRGTHHAQQLRKGGEFLTHVWLLMAHLGITNQFQISQGHARAKLRTK